MYRPVRSGKRVLRLQRNCAKGLLVLRNILSKNVPERFGLLRAEVDALLILNVYMIGCVLVDQSESKKEVPHTYAHLHTVGIVFAVIRCLRERDFGLWRL